MQRAGVEAQVGQPAAPRSATGCRAASITGRAQRPDHGRALQIQPRRVEHQAVDPLGMLGGPQRGDQTAGRVTHQDQLVVVRRRSGRRPRPAPTSYSSRSVMKPAQMPAPQAAAVAAQVEGVEVEAQLGQTCRPGGSGRSSRSSRAGRARPARRGGGVARTRVATSSTLVGLPRQRGAASGQRQLGADSKPVDRESASQLHRAIDFTELAEFTRVPSAARGAGLLDQAPVDRVPVGLALVGRHGGHDAAAPEPDEDQRQQDARRSRRRSGSSRRPERSCTGSRS